MHCSCSPSLLSHIDLALQSFAGSFGTGISGSAATTHNRSYCDAHREHIRRVHGRPCLFRHSTAPQDPCCIGPPHSCTPDAAVAHLPADSNPPLLSLYGTSEGHMAPYYHPCRSIPQGGVEAEAAEQLPSQQQPLMTKASKLASLAWASWGQQWYGSMASVLSFILCHRSSGAVRSACVSVYSGDVCSDR